MKTIVEKIFYKIEDFIELDEAAYLEIKEGELIPVYKRDTKTLPMDDWIIFHKKYRSFVKDSKFLIELVEHKKNAIIKDTNQLPKKPIEFEVLDIQSIYLFPVINKGKVKGIIDLAFRGNKYELSSEEINKISNIVSLYQNNF